MSSVLNFNIFNIFIISASIHGLIFAFVVLFSKKFNGQTNRYLAYVVLLISINNLYYLVIDTGLYKFLGWKYYGLYTIPWDLLMLPMYYTFVVSYLNKKELISKYFKYPFYLAASLHLLIIFTHTFFKAYKKIYIPFYYELNGFLEYFTIVFTIFIIYKAYKVITTYEKETKNTVSIQTKWLKQLLYVAISICIFWSLVLIYNSIFPENVLNDREKYYFIWITMSLLIYWLGYLGVYYVGIFNQREIIRQVLNTEIKKATKTNSNGNNRFTEIDEYIKNNKSYLDSNLTLISLAEEFNLSEGYLSQLINKNMNVNFSTYINNLRIEESKLLLTNKDYKDYTIIAIALESGFNSKSAFYNAFKKSTGVSPSLFKKQH